jgi:hypothetical protein
MQIERFNTKLCCGGTGLSLKLSVLLHKDFIPLLIMGNFSAPPAFTKAGIFYLESRDLTATGSFGSNILQIRCKNNENCQQSIDAFEGILAKME